MSKYNRWIYIINSFIEYSRLEDGELFYYSEGKTLYLKHEDVDDIIISTPEILDHINDFNNPHFISKDNLGLSRIPNVPLASLKDFNEHIEDCDNPHEVTKEQVGLDIIKNYKFATDEDVKNRVQEKYISPNQVKYVVDDLISEYLDDNQIRVSVSTNSNNHLLSLRKIGSAIWTNGNLQVVDIGVYEYRVISPGFYDKVGRINLISDRNIHFDLVKVDGISLDSQKMDGSNDVIAAIGGDNSVYVWGDDSNGVIRGSSELANSSYRHIYSYKDVFTIVSDDGSLYHWGNGVSRYPFLKKISPDIRYISFAMNSSACVLIDEDSKIHSYGDEIYVDQSPYKRKFKQIHCNENMFIGIDINGEIIGWGSDVDKMLLDTPLGSYNYISVSDTDIVAINDSGYIRKWGDKGLIELDNIPTDETSMININGSSMVSISIGGDVRIHGEIKDLVSEVFKEGMYKSCLLPNPYTLILTNINNEIEVYPKSLSLVYTSSPKNKVF